MPASPHDLPIVLKELVNLSTAWRRRRFKLPHKKQLLGLPAGQCLKVKAATFGKAGIEQAFNPVSTDETPGEVVLLVKVGNSALPAPKPPSPQESFTEGLYSTMQPGSVIPANSTPSGLNLCPGHL